MKVTISQSLFWSVVAIGGVLIAPTILGRSEGLGGSESDLSGSEGLLDPVEYTPVNAHLLASSIDVRATYLLSKFRGENALQLAENYQIELTQRVSETQSRLGLFDGEASAFSELSNQYSELLAVETVIFWLNNPQTAKTKLTIPLNKPIELSGSKDDEW